MSYYCANNAIFVAIYPRDNKSVLWDLLEKYPDFRYFDDTNLMRTMQDIYNKTKRQFVIIIDEWDCIFREYKTDREAQEKYLDFLRDLLKDKGYLALVYMTGILPIKKYGTHSALNMFDEFSMIDSGSLAEYVGFTEEEVRSLKSIEEFGRYTQCNLAEKICTSSRGNPTGTFRDVSYTVQ